MLGAIIGDIAGSRFEFNPTNDYNFEIFAAGSDYTDDTICTVAVMDAILHGKDFGESLHEWCRRYPDPMGAYGGRFYNWVHSRDPKPYNSFGNGSAMRVSPVGWAYHNKFTMLLMASKSAECTHNHIEGIKGAQTVALAIHRAIELNNSYETFGKEQMRDLLNTCVEHSDYDINIKLEDVQNKFDETCQGTVPVALWIIGQSNSFEDAIRRAVSLGADADTLGAIVGSIAEAIWGIPDEMMMEALEFLPMEMTSVVVRFYNRYVPDTILRGYGDEGAAEDFLKEEELREAAQPKMIRKKTVDQWFEGCKDHICEGCIYADGIRRWDNDPNKDVMGCGRLGYNSFRRNYTADECEYKKISLYIPSAFEIRKKEEALRKKREEEENQLRQYRKEQRLLKLDKQDGTYERQLIKDFIEQKLAGDINRMIDFDFNTLKNDEKFGDCRGFAFSVEKTNIMKAIMSVAFGDLWPGLSQDSLDNYTYNVTSINQMHYLFGANILDQYFKGMQEFHPTKEQHERAVRVSHLLDTIGNLWILPGNIDADKDTYHYHGYADLFLKDLYNVMTGNGKARPDLKGTVYNARKQMEHLKGEEGFEKLARGLFLDDFLDYYGKPTDVLPQIWFLMKSLKQETYFKAVDDYCTFMERFVPKRAKLIVEKLSRELSLENRTLQNHVNELLEEEHQNVFSHIGYAFLIAIKKVVKDKKHEDKSYLFKTLDALSLEDGYALGLKLAEDVGMGDESYFYTHSIIDTKIDQPVPPIPTAIYDDNEYKEEHTLLEHINVERTACGIWQAYLLSMAPTVLPTFWHGGYIRRTYIFSHKDLEEIDELRRNGEAPLFGIKDVVSPKVKIRGSEGTIECCYWNDWEGLVRETLKVMYANNSVISITQTKAEVLYEYDCGICF
jgi:ADP-ribosylglycohydrolase